MPVWLGMTLKRAVGDRLVLEREPEWLAEVSIDVAHGYGAVRLGNQAIGVRQWLDLEVPANDLGEPLLLGGSEPSDQAVGWKHRQSGVLERDEAHQHVPVRPVTADLLGVNPRGLVAMVPIGDQE